MRLIKKPPAAPCCCCWCWLQRRRARAVVTLKGSKDKTKYKVKTVAVFLLPLSLFVSTAQYYNLWEQHRRVPKLIHSPMSTHRRRR